MSIDDMMEKADDEEMHVRIVDIDGIEYIGIAGGYCKADDEEDGIPTVCIDTDNGEYWCLDENEIVLIEEVEKTPKIGPN